MKRLAMAFIILSLSSFVWADGGVIPPNEAELAKIKSGEASEARVSYWGFNPEDSTEALQAALDSGIPKIIVDKMDSPWITRPLYFNSDHQELFFEEGVEILAKAGEFLDVGHCLMTIGSRSDIAIHGNGATLKMRKEDYHHEPYQLSEWRHAINLCGAKNILIENLNLIESGGDGIYVGAAYNGPCENITVKNIVSDGNNRQGISIISVKGLHVYDSVFKNTKGTNPQTGLDFEPNAPTDYLQDILFQNCAFEHNQAEGISFFLIQLNDTSAPLDITFDHCRTLLNDGNGLTVTMPNGLKELKGTIAFKDCVFDADFTGGIQISNKVDSGTLLTFENVTLKNPCSRAWDNGKMSRCPIILDSGVRDVLPAGGIVFNNVEIIDPNERPEFLFKDGSRTALGTANINGEIRVKRSEEGPVVETITLNDAYFAERYPNANPDRIPLLAPEQNAFLPYNNLSSVKFPFKPKEAPSVHANKQGDFRFYAEAGQTIEFTIQEFPYADIAKEPVTPEWTTPSGETTKLEPLEFKATHTYKVKAEETGIYKFWINMNPHDIVISECSVPFVFWAEPYGMALDYAQEFFFYVPAETKKFGMKFDDGNYTATVTDPYGKVVWTGKRLPTVFIPDGEIKPGVWSVKFDRVEGQGMGTVCFSLLGVPSYLATERGAVFVPHKK